MGLILIVMMMLSSDGSIALTLFCRVFLWRVSVIVNEQVHIVALMRFELCEQIIVPDVKRLNVPIKGIMLFAVFINPFIIVSLPR